MEAIEILNEFIIESTENLSRLDREMVELEARPGDSLLLGSIFRTIHTIKGTCGFLGFNVLERITHHAENILSQVRNGERELTQELVSLILETVDAIKLELTSIEATSLESGAVYDDLVTRQEAAATLVEIDPSPVPETPRVSIATLAGSIEKEIQVPSVIPPSTQTSAFSEDTAVVPQKNVSVADSTIRVDVGQLDVLLRNYGSVFGKCRGLGAWRDYRRDLDLFFD